MASVIAGDDIGVARGSPNLISVPVCTEVPLTGTGQLGATTCTLANVLPGLQWAIIQEQGNTLPAVLLRLPNDDA
eukprot:TRINITY_DN6692_c0_g1_i1.p5 TRINITY_DN6692_c0_g1~~TRINITY_DN6692_c0_g1_i1.p5  ORF type:complete len:75 (-),score=7.87 TRINITY_DN6692_c0_g1_i1:453-677(-)